MIGLRLSNYLAKIPVACIYYSGDIGWESSSSPLLFSEVSKKLGLGRVSHLLNLQFTTL